MPNGVMHVLTDCSKCGGRGFVFNGQRDAPCEAKCDWGKVWRSEFSPGSAVIAPTDEDIREAELSREIAALKVERNTYRNALREIQVASEIDCARELATRALEAAR